jgi:hypothetical protein
MENNKANKKFNVDELRQKYKAQSGSINSVIN